jgi:predicted glycoside hydrolase/deacetylase ChbG (UPF0249 family)
MKLIINADDFAQSVAINKSIFQMYKQGIVTSTSILVGGEGFDNAVNIVKDNPKLDLGLHLALDGPYNIGKEYYTLFNKETNQFHDIYGFLNKIHRFSIDENEIYNEFSRQIEKAFDYHLKISHLDTHHHIHIHLPVLNSMIKAAKKYKIKFIRSQKIICRENQFPNNKVYRFFHQTLLKSKLQTIDGLYEPLEINGQNKSVEYLRLLKLNNMKGIYEIMLHPGAKDNQETQFYSSIDVIKLLNRNELISYHDLS